MEYFSNCTGIYLDVLHEIVNSGMTFEDKNALLTGVGKGSIGDEILKGLLSDGTHVVVATSRYSRATDEFYQSIIQRFGSCGSALTVVPFNQDSKQDVEALVDYIFATLGLDLLHPALRRRIKNGCEIDGLGDRSELAHRITLVNSSADLVPSRPRRLAATSSPASPASPFLCLPTTVCSVTTVSALQDFPETLFNC